MARRVRFFDFDGAVDLSAALRVIRAALEDEGLALSDANTPDRPKAYRVSGKTRIVVPLSRIVLRGD